jgi:hypothetical protein
MDGCDMVLGDFPRVLVLGLLLSCCTACGFDPPESVELAEGAEITKEVSTLLDSERFDELDSLADGYRSTKARTSSGLWKLAYFYGAFTEIFPRQYQSTGIWARLAEPVEHWIKHSPNSPAARLAYATMLINQAWGIRGMGYADTVEPQQWTPFFAKAEQARQYLEMVKPIASGDPNWYRAMIEVATMQGWDEAHYYALLHEALNREPLYYDTYFTAANRDLPKWYGDADKVEALAQEAVRRTRTSDGAGLYARIYWSASAGGFKDELFETSHVDWLEMKRGIDDVLSQYPDDWNLNHFAKFACLAGDYAKAAELIDRIKDKPLPSVWGPFFYMERCRLWAMIVA